MKRWMFFGPLALFALLAGFAAYQLGQPRDDTVRSAMIGKPVPGFDLQPVVDGTPGAKSAALAAGQPHLLNIWASWCVPCVAEAPQLELLRERGVPIVGIAIRDTPEDVGHFLAAHGNPYTGLGIDPISRVQLEMGSSGVPETFVVDGRGVITYQHVGDIRAEHVPVLLEKLAEAR